MIQHSMSTFAFVYSYRVPLSGTFHSWLVDDYYDDYTIVMVSGNTIIFYGIEYPTQLNYYTTVIKDKGSQNYLAQGFADNSYQGWAMYTYGSAGKQLIQNEINFVFIGAHTIIIMRYQPLNAFIYSMELICKEPE